MRISEKVIYADTDNYPYPYPYPIPKLKPYPYPNPHKKYPYPYPNPQLSVSAYPNPQKFGYGSGFGRVISDPFAPLDQWLTDFEIACVNYLVQIILIYTYFQNTQLPRDIVFQAFFTVYLYSQIY